MGSRSEYRARQRHRPSTGSRTEETQGQPVEAGFVAHDRPLGPRRVKRNLLAQGVECRLLGIKRMLRRQAVRATWRVVRTWAQNGWPE